MKKIIIAFIAILTFAPVCAEDIIQAVPSIIKPNTKSLIDISLSNSSFDVANLQFDLLLPIGIELTGSKKFTARVPRTYDELEEKYNYDFNYQTNVQESGYTRFMFIPGGETRPISIGTGTIVQIQVNVSSTMTAGVYPILMTNIKLVKTVSESISIPSATSYIVVSEDGTTNPLSTSATIDLSGMTGYMPSFVVSELNTAIASNTNLKTLNLSGVTGLGADLVVPEGAFWHTSNAAKLNRTFSSGVKSTICLPFAISSSARDEMGKFYQFDGITDGKVVMREAAAGDLPANVPYIFDPSSNVAGISVTDATISFSNSPVTENAEAKFTFTGTYSSITWPSPSGIYGFATAGHDGWTAGQFVRAGAGASIAPYRAYLAYTGEGTLNASRRTRGDDGLPDSMPVIYITNNGETTGIATVDTPQVEEASEWYSLDGMRYAEKPSRKGIYINNGRKVVIK